MSAIEIIYSITNKDELRTALLLHEYAKKEDINIGVNVQGETLVIIAALHGNSFALQTLIQHGASTDVRDNLGRTALRHACQFGYADCVRVLLDAGAKRNIQDDLKFIPLEYAISNGYQEIIDMFYEDESNS